jgi:hypothetical protein
MTIRLDNVWKAAAAYHAPLTNAEFAGEKKIEGTTK